MLFLLSLATAFARLKAGSNPSQTNKSSILKLERTRHATNPGGVATGDRTFGGNKNFRDSLAVGVAEGTKANSTFQVTGSVATNLTKVSTSYTVNAGDSTVPADAPGY
jgi:hypothetical protein